MIFLWMNKDKKYSFFESIIGKIMMESKIIKIFNLFAIYKKRIFCFFF